MRPDDVMEQAESEHDAMCEEGAACRMREVHIERAYVPRILRDRLKVAEKEIRRLRGLVASMGDGGGHE
jgi:hypothetical protein